MTSEKDNIERKALELIEKSLLIPHAERRDFIVKNSNNKPEVRSRALAILGKNEGEPSLLMTGGALEHASDFSLPDFVGAYRIEKEIGRGGMGSVYLGRRIADDFDHFAAIKVVRADFVSPRLVDRLRDERRTLAKLKHPNIAQMYDGGETETGAPYFVMEYVDGSGLNEFVDQTNPSIDERLNIFNDVCSAVSFAHRHLVIHRDLTPSNVLVSGEGLVKLIDFGIAHSLGEETNANAPKTTMTKGYAAPERSDGEPTSTITDIYSLGIILGELVDGQPAPRGGDLRAIVSKASAAAPQERYQTVDALAADIESYRRGEAVSAVEGGWRYGFARFVGRRKLAVGASITAFAASIIAGLIMTVLFLRADAAEKHAVLASQEATARFNDVRELSNFFIFEFHDEIAKLNGSTQAREILVNKALEYLDKLDSGGGASVDLKLEIARGYKVLSDVSGNPNYINLGRYEDASILLSEAAERIRMLKQESDRADVLDAFVEILFAEGSHEGLSKDNYKRAIAIFDEAQTVSSVEVSKGRASFAMQLNDAYIDTVKGYSLSNLYKGDEAIALLKVAVSKYEALVAARPDDPVARLGLARANVTLAEAISWHEYFTGSGDYEATLPYFDKGITENESLIVNSDATLRAKSHMVIALLKRANTTCSMQDRTFRHQGADDLGKASKINNQLIDDNPNNSRARDLRRFLSMAQIECLSNADKIEEAVLVGDKAISLHKAAIKERPNDPVPLKDLANTFLVLSSVHKNVEQWEEACMAGTSANAALLKYSELQTADSEQVKREKTGVTELLAECREHGL